MEQTTAAKKPFEPKMGDKVILNFGTGETNASIYAIRFEVTGEVRYDLLIFPPVGPGKEEVVTMVRDVLRAYVFPR